MASGAVWSLRGAVMRKENALKRLITTSWQFFAVYKTVRNVAFFCAAFSTLWT